MAAAYATALPRHRGPFTGKGKLYIEAFAGHSIQPFLGSEDPREAQGIGVGFYRPGPRRLRIRNHVPELLIEGYYHRSTSPGASGVGPNGTDAYGFLALARYQSNRREGLAIYADFGLGLQYADMRTVDLSGRLSSTPTLGIGLSMGEDAGRQLLFGFRYFHISNAGLQGNNQGQNQFLVTMGLRF